MFYATLFQTQKIMRYDVMGAVAGASLVVRLSVRRELNRLRTQICGSPVRPEIDGGNMATRYENTVEGYLDLLIAKEGYWELWASSPTPADLWDRTIDDAKAAVVAGAMTEAQTHWFYQAHNDDFTRKAVPDSLARCAHPMIEPKLEAIDWTDDDIVSLNHARYLVKIIGHAKKGVHDGALQGQTLSLPADDDIEAKLTLYSGGASYSSDSTSHGYAVGIDYLQDLISRWLEIQD